MEMVHLIGAEQVERAAYAIRSAAETMERAAATMDAAVDRLTRALDESASRIERALGKDLNEHHATLAGTAGAYLVLYSWTVRKRLD